MYSLRNALFHEIITPLDEEWQQIFKSAYLILKQISDVCITTINNIIEFSKSKENAVFNYVTDHPNACFSTLANYVELLDYNKMILRSWKIDRGKIVLTGWFLVTLKLQNGSSEDLEFGAGNIKDGDYGFDFEVTLDEDFRIVNDNESDKKCITILLQRS